MKADNMDTPDRQRREFLLALAVGGVGAVAALTGSQHAEVPTEPAAAPEPAGGKSYQASAHVLKYYRTAKV